MTTKTQPMLSCVFVAILAGAAAGQGLAEGRVILRQGGGHGDGCCPDHGAGHRDGNRAGHGEERGEGRGADGYFDTVYNCMPDETGRLSGGKLRLWVDRSAEREPMRAAHVETLTPMDSTGSNRIHIAFVGDGYTQAELGQYAQHVNNMTAAFFNKEPFITYAPFFAVHRVDVVSNVSGVSHDPVYPIWRNTPLQMEFWCNGMERLLCVNVGLAYNYANNAPAAHLVAAVANSTKYGGAGYITSNLATASGGNIWSPEILLHEFGHALGNLADEYDYNDGAVYTGPERPESNVSIRTAAQMAQLNVKWANWLGTNNPQFDGMISAYEGARFFQFGLYRPTNNSIMRSLGRPFNLPSIEATLIEMYKIVRPIDDASPVGPVYSGTEQLWVQPVQPAGHSLSVQWLLDGQPIPGATGLSLELGALPLAGEHTVRAVVRDQTQWVRNEAARNQWLTETRTYSIVAETCYANCDGSTVAPILTVDDFTCFINHFAAAQSLPHEQQITHYANCDGSTAAPVLTVDDFTCFINAFAGGCP